MLELGAVLVFLATAGIAGFLIWLESYDDGLAGRIALWGILGSSVVLALQIVRIPPLEDYLPAASVLAGSFLTFFTRHAYRHWRFTTKGMYSWKVKPPKPHCKRANFELV